MSKNFELLQQVGSEEELFRPSSQPIGADQIAENGAGVDLDQEVRERILQNASLPDVFQTPSKAATIVGAASAAPSVFRSSRNPSGPIGLVVPDHGLEPGKEAQARVQHEVSLPEAPRTSKRAPRPRVSVSPVPSFDSGKRGQGDKLPMASRSARWIELIKEGARSWGQSLPELNINDGTEREVIAREEEIKLVQRVFPETDHHSTRVALFAGLEKDAGCAPICARTARILAARADGAVCVVDANFRSPSLHHQFGVENRNGLAEAVLGCGLKECAQKLPECDLWVMPSGRAVASMNFPEVSERMRATLTALRETFRYVVVHSSPFRQDTISNFLSRWTDGVVLVVEANATPRDAARRVKENLAAAKVSVLGVVLNNRTFPIPEALYRRL